jgi:hypothetical protein
MYLWTDAKSTSIRFTFYRLLGISLPQYVHQQAKAAREGSLCSTRSKARKAPNRAAYVLSEKTLAQQAVAKALKLGVRQITQLW